MFRVLKLACRNLINEGVAINGLTESAASRAATVSGIHIHHSLHRDNETPSISRVEATDSLKSESNSFQNNHIASVAKSTESKKQDKEYEDNVKNKILEASLNYVAEHGWTKAAIVAGAQSVGYPGVVSEMFPLGGSNLVLYFYSVCNRRLSEYLKTKAENEPPDADK